MYTFNTKYNDLTLYTGYKSPLFSVCTVTECNIILKMLQEFERRSWTGLW